MAMRKQIYFALLVSLFIALTACGRMGDLVPINESKVDSVETVASS